MLVEEKMRMEEKADYKDILLPPAEGSQLYEYEPVDFVGHSDVITGKC